MEKIEKRRKLFRWIQTGGMIFIMVVGMGLIWFFGLRKAPDTQTGLFNSMTYIMGVILVLFVFLTFIGAPLQNKLLKMVILESLNGLVDDVTFNRKKGYTKESFLKLHLSPATFSQYGNSDYYSFKYHDMTIESTTVKAFDEYKVMKQKGVKGSKTHKEQLVYFYGRIYVIPYQTDMKVNIFGRSNGKSKKKELAASDTKYKNEIPLKVKKYAENFEVFYGDEKPQDIQSFLDKLFYLRQQAHGEVSCFLRDNTMILCINNSHYYQEIDFKNKIEPTLISQYRKDVNMVLTFLNGLERR